MSGNYEETLQYIDADTIDGIVLREARLIDNAGTDSEVYEWGGAAIHKYEPFIDLPLLFAYSGYMEMATLFNGRQRMVDDTLYTFGVVHFDHIIKSLSGRLYSISRYIPGGNLSERKRNGTLDPDTYTQIQDWLNGMTDELEQLTGVHHLILSFGSTNTSIDEETAAVWATDICTHMLFLAGRGISDYFA